MGAKKLPHKRRPVLTDTQLAYRESIVAAEQHLSALLEQCPHSIVKDEGHCAICEKCYGHWCPSSPDSVCHYYTNEHNKVELINGQQVDCPDSHDVEYETDDSCIFCHQPEERK